jgi:hypothetical protein
MFSVLIFFVFAECCVCRKPHPTTQLTPAQAGEGDSHGEDLNPVLLD